MASLRGHPRLLRRVTHLELLNGKAVGQCVGPGVGGVVRWARENDGHGLRARCGAAGNRDAARHLRGADVDVARSWNCPDGDTVYGRHLRWRVYTGVQVDCEGERCAAVPARGGDAENAVSAASSSSTNG